MVTAHWLQVSEPETYARKVLREEEPEIPESLVAGRSWTQIAMLPTDLAVDESMISRHDDDPLHRDRRDQFRDAILAGRELPPMIAIGPDHHLVDGYARLRAVRLLRVQEVSVIVQLR